MGKISIAEEQYNKFKDNYNKCFSNEVIDINTLESLLKEIMIPIHFYKLENEFNILCEIYKLKISIISKLLKLNNNRIKYEKLIISTKLDLIKSKNNLELMDIESDLKNILNEIFEIRNKYKDNLDIFEFYKKVIIDIYNMDINDKSKITFNKVIINEINKLEEKLKSNDKNGRLLSDASFLYCISINNKTDLNINPESIDTINIVIKYAHDAHFNFGEPVHTLTGLFSVYIDLVEENKNEKIVSESIRTWIKPMAECLTIIKEQADEGDRRSLKQYNKSNFKYCFEYYLNSVALPIIIAQGNDIKLIKECLNFNYQFIMADDSEEYFKIEQGTIQRIIPTLESLFKNKLYRLCSGLSGLMYQTYCDLKYDDSPFINLDLSSDEENENSNERSYLFTEDEENEILSILNLQIKSQYLEFENNSVLKDMK